MLKQASDQLGARDPAAGDLEVEPPAASPELAPGNIPLSSFSVFSLLDTTILHALRWCSFFNRESFLSHGVPSGSIVAVVIGVG